MAYDKAKDRMRGRGQLRGDPAETGVAVTPSNTVDFTTYPSAFYVGVAGDVAYTPLMAATDTAVVLKAHPVGYMLVRARRIWVTGTTATNIVALGA